MDKIFLRGLEVRCIIGVDEWEREVPQTLRLDLEFRTDVACTARSDDLAAATDYDAVARAVVAMAEGSRFHLIETLAEEVAGLCREKLGIGWIRVRVAKPGAIRGAEEVGVEIVRGE